MTVGSSSAIFACGAARLELRVAFCGVVGDDVFGRFMLDEMAGAGSMSRRVRSTRIGRPARRSSSRVARDRAILTAMGMIGALDVDSVPPR